MYKQIELWSEPVEKLRGKHKFICEMSNHDHGFLCGMIKEVKPKKILELGVAEGGSTAIIMETLAMLGLDSEVWSVDLNENFYHDSTKKTGYEYIKLEKEYADRWSKHHFLFGKAIPGQIDTIGNGIDMAIIDTTHKMPGEVMDFLCIFPYLQPGATIVLHDVNLNHHGALYWKSGSFMTAKDAIATKILFSTVVADKYMVLRQGGKLPNIAAFSINENTEKYLDDLFFMLTMTWSYIPNDEMMQEYRSLLERFYTEERMECFNMALRNNHQIKERIELKGIVGDGEVPAIAYIFPYSRIPEGSKIAIYGAGVVGKEVHALQTLKKQYKVTVWVDKNSEAYRQMGLMVKAPEELLKSEYDYIVVAVETESVFAEIRDEILRNKWNNGKEIIGPIERN